MALQPTRANGSSPPLEDLLLVIRCLDLTLLEETATPEQVERLCDRAVRPASADHSVPHVAAVVVYPAHVPLAARRLEGTGVLVATVTGDFPTGVASVSRRVAEIERVDSGADEIDTVMDRSAFVAGEEQRVREEISASRKACGPDVTLKVILETSELGSPDLIRRASLLAMSAGADFVKTSTGKIGDGASPAAVRTIAEAASEFLAETGRLVGVKVAGGVRRAGQAIEYMDVVRRTLGQRWMSPERFRVGASMLLDDVLARIAARG